MAALVNYSESSEEDSDGDVKNNSSSKSASDVKNQKDVPKRGRDDNCNYDQEKKKMRTQMPELEMPREILEMFGKTESSKRSAEEEAACHGGRIRSFAHLEGNWATFAHIPYEMDDHAFKLRDELFKLLRTWGEFQPMDDHHISLSRTVVIRHHWIAPLQESIRVGITSYNIAKCVCQFSGITIYTNDEKTRSFLGLDVNSASDTLENLTMVVDEAFSEFRLPAYYKNPSYHMSIGWVLGDITVDLPPHIMDQLQKILEIHLEEEPELRMIYINEMRLKTGNKTFSFPLSNG